VNQIHLDWSASPGGYGESLIRTQTRSVIRDVVSDFQAEEIYGIGREAMQAAIDAELRSRIEARGFFFNDLLVRNITFSEEFAQAIEDKQIAEQNLAKARTQAEQNRTEAKGRADAVIETARGDAESTLVRASANAEALRLVSEQIAANPNLLQYVYIQTLADNIKLALIPSNTPFLFNSDTFTQLEPDFVPPALPETTEAGDGG
jgi:prohibitin 2